MYGITEDKSQWNLGLWITVLLNRSDFGPGIGVSDPMIAEKCARKYVAQYLFNTSGTVYHVLEQICGEYTKPALIWDVVHQNNDGTGYGHGLENLTEREQEDAAIIEDVYFKNEQLYVVAKEMPLGKVLIRIKGA